MLIGVTYGNGLFIAVGEADTLITSPDGSNWIPRSSGTANKMLAGVSYGNGMYVVTMFDSGLTTSGKTILTSFTGIDWTIRDIGIATALTDVTYGGSLFVAVGGPDAVFTSPDGITWTLRRYGQSIPPQYFGVSYGNGTFVVSGVGGVILQSAPLEIGTSAISGTATAGGIGLQGVTITLTGPVSKTTTTAADGSYSLTGLLDGAYTVTPSLIGYVFTPQSRNVTISDNSATDQDFPAVPQQFTLNVTITGTGSGTVTSDPPGVTCNITTSKQFAAGSAFTLHAAPAQFSLFSGWSGICGGTGDCSITMDGDKTVMATFDLATPNRVRLDGVGQSYHSSILSAYLAAGSGDTIRMWGTDFTEDFTFGLGKPVTLKGGYDSSYSTNSGYTTLNGIFTILNGSLTVENLVIR